MSSVNGLVSVCVYKARGITAPPAAHLYLRVRLLPWKEEGFTGSVTSSDGGEAIWDNTDKNEVTLAHLSTTATSAPCVEIELRSRELYVYDRSLGSGQVDISDLVADELDSPRALERETWVSLNTDSSSAETRVLLRIEYTRGASRVLKASLRRAASDYAFRQHLFRLTSYNRPTWCAVCDGLLVGIRHQGFKCEACGLDCHPDCQLKAHASYECEPDAWRQTSIQQERDDVDLNAIATAADEVSSILSSIDDQEEVSQAKIIVNEDEIRMSANSKRAAVPSRDPLTPHSLPPATFEKVVMEPRKISIDQSTPDLHKSGADSTTARVKPHNHFDVDTTHQNEENQPNANEKKGIGRLKIKLHSCRLINDEIPGDHYVRISIRPSKKAAPSKSRRTHTVYQSASPVFEVSWNLSVDTFGSMVCLELVDAARDVIVGTLWFGVHCLLQEPADFVAAQWAKSVQETLSEARRYVQKKKRDDDEFVKMHLLPPKFSYFAEAENRYFRDARGNPTAVAEFEDCELEVLSDDFFWCMAPRDAPWDYWPDTFSIEIAKKHINRARTVVRSISAAYAAYEDIMRWRDPVLTLVLFVLYMACCIYLNAEYAGVIPMIMLGVLLLLTLRNRLFRLRPRSRFFATAAKNLAENEGLGDERYRPLAKVKVAVCAGRLAQVGDYYATIAFVHGPPLIDEDDEHNLNKVPAPAAAVPPTQKVDDFPMNSDHKRSLRRRRRRERQRRRRNISNTAFEEDPRSEDELLLDLLHEDDDSDDFSDDDEMQLDLDPQQQPLGGLIGVDQHRTSFTSLSQESYHTINKSTMTRSSTTPKKSGDHLIEHILGYTGTCRKTNEPRWHGNMGVSVDARRRRVDATGVLSRLVGSLSNDGHGTASGYALMDVWERRGLGDQSLVDRALVYPILQPLKNDETLLPWTKSGGRLIFRIFKQHPLDRFLDTEIGRVSVPLPSLVDEPGHSGIQRERRGWYTLELVEESIDEIEAHDNSLSVASIRNTSIAGIPNGVSPAVNLRLQLELCPVRNTPTEYELEISRAVDAMSKPLPDNDPEIQHTYTRGLLSTKATRGNNPLSTVVSVHANATYAQNVLGLVLDVLESFKNALNWTHPHKTLFIFICTLFGIIIFARIPSRWLFMCAGLYEFTIRLLPFGSGSPMTTRCLNLLKSLPNDADLESFYHYRALNHAQEVVKRERKRRRRAKIHAIWQPRFEGLAYLRDDPGHHNNLEGSGDTATSGSLRRRHYSKAETEKSSESSHWGTERFFILLGRRFLWWTSERDLDIGRAPGGQLLLLGHCGLTDPSPTDLVGCSPQSVHLILVIFGQTVEGIPIRWSILFQSAQAKARLATAIHHCCFLVLSSCSFFFKGLFFLS